jgi:polyhydroxybutyrate depolymerase
MIGREHPYLLAVVGDVQKRYRTNPNRVYATGHSAGGFMSHSLAMLYPEVFAAVASVAGGVPPEYFPYPGTNRYAVAVMEIHNQADSVVDYGGVPAAMRFWCRFNGCAGTPVTSKFSEILTQVRYCQSPAEVVLLHFDDNSDDFGHHWPRRKYYGFEATEPIWQFLSRHQLSAP